MTRPPAPYQGAGGLVFWLSLIGVSIIASLSVARSMFVILLVRFGILFRLLI
nr:MAG TPA: hypothetical protein [Caudoviricetes sp.]